MAILEKTMEILKVHVRCCCCSPEVFFTPRTCGLSRTPTSCSLGDLNDGCSYPTRLEYTPTLWVTRHTLCALYMADNRLRAASSTMGKPRPHLTAPATNGHREDKHTHHQNKTYHWALHKKETNPVSKDFKVLREGQIRFWYGKDTWGQLGQEILFFGMGTIFNKQKRGRTEYK